MRLLVVDDDRALRDVLRRALTLASYNELRIQHRVVDVSRLPHLRSSRFHDEFRILWIEARDLLAAEHAERSRRVRAAARRLRPGGTAALSRG